MQLFVEVPDELAKYFLECFPKKEEQSALFTNFLQTHLHNKNAQSSCEFFGMWANHDKTADVDGHIGQLRRGRQSANQKHYRFIDGLILEKFSV